MEKRQHLLAFLFFLIAFSLIYLVFWDDFISSVRSFRVWRETVKESQSLTSLISDMPRLSKRYDKVSSQSLPLFQALPSEFSQSDVLQSLSSLASQNGLVITKIDIKKPDLEHAVMVELALTGSIGSFERFLRSLELALPLFDLEATAFQAFEGLQTFSLRLKTYVLASQPSQTESYTQLRKNIEEALTANLDILKDPRFSQFRAVPEVPVPLPSSDVVGRSDPFAPL